MYYYTLFKKYCIIIMDKIFVIGVSILFFYSLSKVLNFWGVGEDVYGVYILFYIFIIISTLILPLRLGES